MCSSATEDQKLVLVPGLPHVIPLKFYVEDNKVETVFLWK